MAEKKYADLVRTLVFQGNFTGAKANARELTFMTGDKLADFEINFILGVYEHPGDWAPNRGSHMHPFDEYLLFFGFNADDMNDFGAELELSMGEEWEKHKITSPSIVIAPKDIPHSPLITEKADKPFAHLHLAMAARYSGSGAERKGETDGGKYKNLYKNLPVCAGPGGADAIQLVTLDSDDLEGHSLNFQMGLYNRAGKWSIPPQVCPFNKLMIFFGHNTDKLSELGAEITVEIGKEREKHTFDAATVIAVPSGTPIYSVTCDKIYKPYRMARVGLAPKYISSPAVNSAD